MLEKSRDFF